MKTRFLLALCLCFGALLLLAPNAEAYEPYPCDTSCSCTSTLDACDWLCKDGLETVTCGEYGVCPGSPLCEGCVSSLNDSSDIADDGMLDGDTVEDVLKPESADPHDDANPDAVPSH